MILNLDFDAGSGAGAWKCAWEVCGYAVERVLGRESEIKRSENEMNASESEFLYFKNYHGQSPWSV